MMGFASLNPSYEPRSVPGIGYFLAARLDIPSEEPTHPISSRISHRD
jgi:hypothetical protein